MNAPRPIDDDVKKPLEHTLSTDFGIVKDSEVSKGKEQFYLILNHRATPEEAEEYFFSRDPLGETVTDAGQKYIDNGQPHLLIQQTLLEATVYEQSSALMAASVAFSELFENKTTGRKWLPTIDQLYTEQSVEFGDVITQPGNVISADEVIRFALHKIRNRELSAEEMRRLMVAAEMIEVAVILEAGSIRATSREAGQEGLNLLKTIYKATFKSPTDIQTAAAINMYHWKLIKDRIVSEVFGNNDVNVDEKMRYALKQEWRWSSEMLALSKPDNNKVIVQNRENTLNNLITLLERSFLETDALSDSSKKAEMKGLLHELLWLLDGYMVILSDEEKYSKTGIKPAMEFEDAPRVGRPELRRGYDYIIGIKGGESRLVQLKSGSKTYGSYHPGVEVLYEENFQDFNRGRLAAKLALYKKALEQGLDTDETRNIVKRYALTTVQLKLEELAEIVEREEELRRLKGAYGLRTTIQSDGRTFSSSAERRKYEKTLRKQAKSRKGRNESNNSED